MKPVPQKKQKLTLRALALRLIIVACMVGLGWLILKLTQFNQSRAVLPPVVSVGGVNVGGMGVNEAITRTASIFQQPLILRYQNETIPVTTEMLEFKINSVVLQVQLEQIINQQRGLASFPAWMLDTVTPQRLAPPFIYSDTKLQAVLASIAKQYDRAPQDAKADAAKLGVSQTRDGQLLAMNEATQLVVVALTSISNRVVNLPVDVVVANRASANVLAELVQNRVAAFIKADTSNLAAVYIKDLRSGQEVLLNGNMAVSAKGWLKLLVLAEVYRNLGDKVTPQLRDQLVEMINTDNKIVGDDMLQAAGNGDIGLGLTQLNDMLRRIGLKNTFMAQPFSRKVSPVSIITPANAALALKPSLDTTAQSTVIDIGLLLESLDQCRKSVGSLTLVFGGKLTGAQCGQILAVLGQNKAAGLLDLALPNVSVAHRQSWDDYNHGDAAIIHSPDSDYVIVVMLSSANKLDWGSSVPIMNDISRAAYAYFNNGQLPPPRTGGFVPPAQ